MSWWVADILQTMGFIGLFSWAFWVIFSITLHELGHGVAAIWQGDDTPIRRGHMNLNPMVHMGPTSMLAFAIIGIAWGAMPVNPHKFRLGRLGDALVSFAGPLVNLLLAFIALTSLALIRSLVTTSSNFTDNLAQFLWVGGFLNLVLLLFNLLPIPPLDGSRILAGLSRSADRFFGSPQVQQFGLFALLAALFFGGSAIFGSAIAVAQWWIDTLANVLP